jgi:phenylalanyl-tRNA synthetase beta chain
MKYSYNWLKELSGTKKTPTQLAKLLMEKAFEVESIEQFSHHLDNVIVGRVTKLEKHSNADKLRVAEVEVGPPTKVFGEAGKKNIIKVVCGAPNIAEGQKVALALSGAKLFGGMEIKKVEIRGVESYGMICSARELGLGNGHSGILVLPADAPTGESFAKYAGLEDSILEIKILPDRGSDALAYRGLAREIAALCGHAPRLAEKQFPSFKIPSDKNKNNCAPKIVISDKHACRRYIGISFENVKVEESPLWIKTKLILSGLHPINNLVDITNYLMLLYGQPMHIFDADKIAGTITIRRAKKNEKLALLTGEIKTLSSEDLVIADEQQVLALAGVMGGAHAAVTEQTKNIFMEIANFDGSSVRRSKVRHNLPTDASYRFERSPDPNLLGEAAYSACALIADLAFGKYIGMCDIYPQIVKQWKISLPLERVRNVLGVEIPPSEIVKYLELLGLVVKKTVSKKSKNTLEVTVPTRRPDLCDEWDLIEEIGRLYGYDKIIPSQPLIKLAPRAENVLKTFEYVVKKYLAYGGFDELLTYSFYGERDQTAACLPRDTHLELANPMNPEQKLLRMTLAPTMLRKISENLRNFDHFNCFEWGSVFTSWQARGDKKPIIKEKKSLMIVSVHPSKGGRKNVSTKTGTEFFALKGNVEALFVAFHIKNITFDPLLVSEKIPEASLLHPTRSAIVRSGEKILGYCGELHPLVAQNFNLNARIALAEFDVTALEASRTTEILFQPLAKFPFATRDISLTFPRILAGRSVTVAEVETLFREAGAPLLKQWELFDVYEKEDEKSLAFHLSFGADDRTLSGEEMDKVFDGIVALAQKRFGARLRL